MLNTMLPLYSFRTSAGSRSPSPSRLSVSSSLLFIFLLMNELLYNNDLGEKRKAQVTWGSQHCLSGLTTSQFASVDTAKAHASVRMREQAAVLSCKCPVEWLIRETIEKAGCSIRVLNYSFFVKHPNILRKNLWTHAVVLYFQYRYF